MGNAQLPGSIIAFLLETVHSIGGTPTFQWLKGENIKMFGSMYYVDLRFGQLPLGTWARSQHHKTVHSGYMILLIWNNMHICSAEH